MHRLLPIISLVFISLIARADFQASFGGTSLTGLQRSTTLVEYRGNVDPSMGNLLDSGKFGLNGAKTGAGTIATRISPIQTPDGNYLVGREFDGSANYYNAGGISARFNMDGDWTFTIFGRFLTGSGVGGLVSTYDGAKGTMLYSSTFRFYGAASSTTVNQSGTADYYHIWQWTKSGNTITCYTDGVLDGTVNASTLGSMQGSNPLQIGTTTGGYPSATLLYARVDQEASTTTQMARDRARLWGISSSNPSIDTSWTVARSTTAYNTTSTGVMYITPSGLPRVGGPGGGVLAEGLGTNLLLQSQTFGTTWTQVALTSITSNGAVAPDGTTTADGIIGDANDAQHGVKQSATMYAGEPATFSVYAKPGNKDWVYLEDATIVNCYAYFNVATGRIGTVGAGCKAQMENVDAYYRPAISFTGTAASHEFRIYAANGDADNDFAGDATTVNTWLWGAQVDSYYPHPTSYMVTGAVNVSRAEDNIYKDATTLLPPLMSSTSVATKLKVKLEFNPEWDRNPSTISRMIVISPTVGSTTKNLVTIYAYPNTIYASVYDNNDTTEHYFSISLAASGNANKWHACELYIDFADQTKSYLIYDGTTDTTFAGGNPHASGVDWTTRYIHVGNWAGYPAFSRIRNLLITYN